MFDPSPLESTAIAVLEASIRWTPIALLAFVAVRFLPAAADRRRLWALVLCLLPSLPLLGLLAPSWTMPEWRAASGFEMAEESPAAAAGERHQGVAPPPPAETEAAGSSGWPPARWLAGLWLLGATALLAREMLARMAAFTLGRTALDAPERVREQALSAARALALQGPGLGRRPDVRLGDVRVPLLCGVFRPRVVLPVASVSWPCPRLRASLLHELAHQRQQDPWLDFCARLLSSLFFFHPAIWLVRRALGREMEQAADAAVVESGAFDRRSYGKILLDVASQARGPEPFAVAGLAMIGLSSARRRGGLESRLLALLRETPRTSWRRRLSASSSLVLLALASAGLTAGLAAQTEGWLLEGESGWFLECGDDAECQAVQAEAKRLLEASGHAGVLLVQKVETGELVAYAARGPAPVPQVPPASVAKLAVAALWWDGGLGDRRVPCTTQWRSPDGVAVRSVRDRGELMVPHEMLIHSCTTAAGAMMQRLVEERGAEEIEAELARFGFAAGSGGGWLPAFLPRPHLDEGAEWEARRPEMAAALGRVSTTPLHIASFVQAIGHGGERLAMGRPGEAETGKERLMTAETAERLRLSMSAVMSEGTGRRGGELLAGESWRLLGKTGTRLRDDDGYDGWFAGLAAEGEAPRYVIVAFLDGGGLGGGATTELAARMTQALGSL